jgi:hypothetical protein
MYMRVKFEFLTPCVRHAEEADFCAEMLWIACDFQKSFRTGAKQEIVDDLLVLQDQRGQMAGRREDHMDVASRSSRGAQYNRKMADIFSVQEEIAKEISEKLRLQLTGEEKRRLAKRVTKNKLPTVSESSVLFPQMVAGKPEQSRRVQPAGDCAGSHPGKCVCRDGLVLRHARELWLLPDRRNVYQGQGRSLAGFAAR